MTPANFLPSSGTSIGFICSNASPSIATIDQYTHSAQAVRLTTSRGIFISNLPMKIGVNDIRAALNQIGQPLSIQIGHMGKKTNAKVSFQTPNEARLAIERLNGATIKGWKIQVRHDREGDSAPSSSPQSRSETASSSSSSQVYPPIANGSNWGGN